MKTRILLTFAVAFTVIAITGGSGTALADGGNGKGRSKGKAPEVVERVLQSKLVFDETGEFLGTAEIVSQEPVQAPESSSAFTTTATASSYTRTKTCTVEFYLKNWYGQKVISYKLSQTFSYNGSRVVSWYRPVISASTKWGWSGSNYRNGYYWLRYLTAERSWASAKFALKVGWFTVQEYRPTIGIDGYGSGYCRPWGYW
jgi:hypothetical protein